MLVVAKAFAPGARKCEGPMIDLKVNSREYKIMLKSGRFPGAESKLFDATRDFWRAALEVMRPVVLDVAGSLDTVKDRRAIRFFDTTDRWLNRNSYIFRERADLDGRSCEVTLKFRHPDRYIAADRDMSATVKGKAAN